MKQRGRVPVTAGSETYQDSFLAVPAKVLRQLYPFARPSIVVSRNAVMPIAIGAAMWIQ